MDRLEELFREAVGRPPEARAAFLEAACLDDPELRREVESLLAAYDEAEADSFLDDEALGGGPSHWAGDLLDDAGLLDEMSLFDRLDELEARVEGQRIGPYTVLRHLGTGGMGEVYLGVRERPFKRQAAIKVIRQGTGSREVYTRFVMERQILASLNHPHIARLYDGGVTEEGRPYLAMEYVEGRPITAYCDEHRLTLGQRLHLFRTACKAVHYAHQNLIIHRDLKPTNILVTEEGDVKLLDFGIAKLVNPQLSPVVMPVTRAEDRLMTPEYASPEQARGEPLTTVADVYALGVILYEMVAGHRPYQVSGRPAQETTRIICEQEPVPPSTRVIRVETIVQRDGTEERITPEAVSARRGVSPERLHRQIRGDLDNLVLKALRKEPDRRYGSAEQLEQDIHRYLEGLPVMARPSTVPYRMRKFVSRHRVGVLAAALVVLSLVGGLSAALWQANEARLERDRAQSEAQRAEEARIQAEAVTNFLTGLFEASDPYEARGEELTALELLERGTARAELLSDQPAVQAQLLNAVGHVYQTLGRYDRAQPLLEQALALRQEEFGPQHPAVAESLHGIGFLLYLKGEYDAAESALQEALAIRRRLGGEASLEVAESLTPLAAVLVRRGEYDAAERLYREALDVRREILGEEHAEVATSLNNLALLLRLRGEYETAEVYLRQALSQWRRFLGEDHPYVAAGLNNLAILLRLKGDYETAERYHREALALRRRLLGDAHPAVARTMTYLATVLRQTGRLDEAEALYRESMDMQQRLLGPHPELAQTMDDLAHLLHQQGRYEEAERFYRQAMGVRRDVLGERHPAMVETLNGLAGLMQEVGHLDEAEALYRQALSTQRELLGDQHPEVARGCLRMAALLHRQGRYGQAEALYREARSIYDQQPGQGGPEMQEVYSGMAALYEAWGRPDDAAQYRALLGGTSRDGL